MELINFQPDNFNDLEDATIDRLLDRTTLYSSIAFKRIFELFKKEKDNLIYHKLSITKQNGFLCFNFKLTFSTYKLMFTVLSDNRSLVKTQFDTLTSFLECSVKRFIDNGNGLVKCLPTIKLNDIEKYNNHAYGLIAKIHQRFHCDLTNNYYPLIPLTYKGMSYLHGMGDIKHSKDDGVSFYFVIENLEP